jgi:multisubunit Na+/H+ antiporter MnhB subunit
MPQDYIVLVGVGGLFIILGLATVIWGKREEKSYFNSLSTRAGDTREFLEHWPRRPQPGALKIGGWIAAAIGVVMLITGGALLLLR